jgi:hypothetical protein
MQTHFEKYLEKMPQAALDNTSGKTINNVLSKQSLGYLNRIFNSFPVNDVNNPPCSPVSIKMLLSWLLDFLQEFKPEDFEPTRLPVLTAHQNHLFNRIMNKMFGVACEELLDETGVLLPAIVTKLGLQPVLDFANNSRNKKLAGMLTKEIIYSYFSQIISAAMINAFEHEGSCRKYVEKNINTKFISKTLLEGLLRSQIIPTTLATLRPDQPRIPIKGAADLVLDTFGKVNRSAEEIWLKKFNEYWPELVKSVGDEHRALTLTTKIKYLITQHFTMHAPDILQGYHDKLFLPAFEVLDDTFAIIYPPATQLPIVFFNAQMQRFFGEDKYALISRKLADYALYGKPLTDNFIHSITPNLDGVLAQKFLVYLTGLLSDIMVAPADEKFQHFVVKLAFLSYGKLLTESGKLKAAYEKKYVVNGKTVGVVTMELAANYVWKRVNHIFLAWMSDAENQKLFFADLPEDRLQTTFKKMKQLLIQGLDATFLDQVKSFPFTATPRIAAYHFAIPFAYQRDEAVIALKRKLQFIKQTIVETELDLQQETAHKAAVGAHEATANKLLDRLRIQSPGLLETAEGHRAIIVAASTAIHSQYIILNKLATGLKAGKLTTNFDKEICDNKLDDIKEDIKQHLARAALAAAELTKALSGLKAKHVKAEPLHAKILAQINDITENSGFWGKRVFGNGGLTVSHAKLPYKVGHMALFLQQPSVQAQTAPGKKLAAIVRCYADKSTEQRNSYGFFKSARSALQRLARSSVTTEFYHIMDKLAQVESDNYYNVDKLKEIHMALKAFSHRNKLPAPSRQASPAI